MPAYDAVVVGGGPSGLATGIRLAKAGRTVLVLERSPDTPDGPGETMHPGIEVIFGELGVATEIRSATGARHAGITVARAGQVEDVPYGNGWRGFQIRRKALNRILETRLHELGGQIQHGVVAGDLSPGPAGHTVDVAGRTLQARWLIDASGPAGWLDRRTGTQMIPRSAQIWLHYGYRPSAADVTGQPHLSLNGQAWEWRAPLGDGETAWVTGSSLRPPDRPFGARGADGTWRLSPCPACVGSFRVGDAACRLDPRNGHGVLRALMSAILAAHLAEAADAGQASRPAVAGIYAQWIRQWFDADARQLRDFQMVADLASARDNLSYERDLFSNLPEQLQTTLEANRGGI